MTETRSAPAKLPPGHPDTIFHTIDGMRGLGVLAILLFHSARPWIEKVIPGTFFMIDMFYVVSGFVLSHAYEAELRQGLSGWNFMRLRMIRVYPFYIASLVLAVAVNFVLMVQAGWLQPKEFGLSIVTSALLLPAFPAIAWRHHHPFPFNGTTWTLLWELLINAIWAWLGPRLSDRLLTVFVVIGVGLLVVAVALPTGLEHGGAFENFHVGPLRVVYGFFAGVAAYRLWARGKLAWLRVPFWGSALAIVAILMLRPVGGNPVFDFGAVLIMPLLIIASTGPSPRWLEPIFGFSGRTAYGIYIFNVPILFALNLALPLFGMSLGGLGPFGVLLFIVINAVGVGLIEKYYDRPARKWLTRRFAPPRPGRRARPTDDQAPTTGDETK